jgi:hypothetical protein
MTPKIIRFPVERARKCAGPEIMEIWQKHMNTPPSVNRVPRPDMFFTDCGPEEDIGELIGSPPK